MQRVRGTRVAWLAGGFLLVSGLAAVSAPADSLRVEDAWLREAPPGQRVAALYMRLHNAGPSSIYIEGVRVPVAESASIHQSTESGGMAGMRAVPVLELAPGAELALTPGGYHIMVFGLKQQPRAGEQLEFCVLLRDDGEMCAISRVKGLQEQ